ncbi:amino acid-binding protein [Desulfosarcina ovata]|uniref:Amino acid-binding protein n=2 Tax=Desulfosarcina ovata TaxID=83564 RepID=A0A5K8ADV0_9BACT|nr:amino acid-binding protein [Desulfosarcina ovata]BBO84218.1 amino acid-binding protein [Desulfosarcina ovata subsp. sediminis]BBO90716.1 amino acid-binding protein [Desulfosarcina ovata subsp. ovata]
MKLKQIVISIENSPNRLYNVIRAMSDAGINLRALNLVDTGAFGQLRLLLSDVAKARRILMEMSVPAFVNEVVATEIPDKPGSLANVMLPMMQSGIRIEFMYAYTGGTLAGQAVMIFRFSDNDKAIAVLQEKGIRILDANTFDIIE